MRYYALLRLLLLKRTRRRRQFEIRPVGDIHENTADTEKIPLVVEDQKPRLVELEAGTANENEIGISPMPELPASEVLLAIAPHSLESNTLSSLQT